MDRQDFTGLYESYLSVYDEDGYLYEDVEEIDEAMAEGPRKEKMIAKQWDPNVSGRDRSNAFNIGKRNEFVGSEKRSTGGKGSRYAHFGDRGAGNANRRRRGLEPIRGNTRNHWANLNASYEYDLYDLVLEYLLDEGLCESVENAEVMMAHMSEEWVDSIIEGYELDEAAIMSVSRGGKPVYQRQKYSPDELENIRKTIHKQRRLKQLNRASESDRRAFQRYMGYKKRYEEGRRKHPTNIMNAKPGESDGYGHDDEGPDAEYHYSKADRETHLAHVRRRARARRGR